MQILELIKAIVLGIVQGITEWLPISSTGHMILIDEFLKLNVSGEFKEMFFVVIQLGSILAVVFLYWNKIMPFSFENGISVKKDTMQMWFKIVVASIPTIIFAIFFDDKLNDKFYNYVTVAIMLIIFGILFIIIENLNKDKKPRVNKISEITYSTALFIGIFQMIAAIFPGTSRSGSTIVAALAVGVARVIATEFTFFLAIPAMFGASLLKMLKFGFSFTSQELAILIIGTVVSFVVSMLAIKFLMRYIKKNDFKPFGWYRIVLGILVLLYFNFIAR